MMATIKRWFDRARGKRTPAPGPRRRGKWITERRDRSGNITMLSRNLADDEWGEYDAPAARGGWLQRGSAARRQRKFRI